MSPKGSVIGNTIIYSMCVTGRTVANPYIAGAAIYGSSVNPVNDAEIITCE